MTNEILTEEQFVKQFGMTPEKARSIMLHIKHLVNAEVKNAIANANYYIDPKNYGYDGPLGKSDIDDDGYTMLYECGEENSAEEIFMSVISIDTNYGGHTSAVEACNTMKIRDEWEKLEDDYYECNDED